MRKGYIYRHWVINDKGEEKSYIGQTVKENPQKKMAKWWKWIYRQKWRKES